MGRVGAMSMFRANGEGMVVGLEVEVRSKAQVC